MACCLSGCAARQQFEGIFQPIGDLREREHFHAGGGQLDRQRQPVKTAADRIDQCEVVGGRFKRGLNFARAIKEELNGVTTLPLPS